MERNCDRPAALIITREYSNFVHLPLSLIYFQKVFLKIDSAFIVVAGVNPFIFSSISLLDSDANCSISYCRQKHNHFIHSDAIALLLKKQTKNGQSLLYIL